MSETAQEQPSKPAWDKAKYKSPLADPEYVRAMTARIAEDVAAEAKLPIHPSNFLDRSR